MIVNYDFSSDEEKPMSKPSKKDDKDDKIKV